MSYKVPLRFDATGAEGAGATTESEGTIEYKADKATLDACPGFFVFTYYIRNPITGEKTFKQAPIYLEGLYSYASILKGPFEKWNLLIYTDQYTYNEMNKLKDTTPPPPPSMPTNRSKSAIQAYRQAFRFYKTSVLTSKLLESKKVIFAVVSWPNHQRSDTPQVNGPALRLMRTRAPFDFPTQYCFGRDADTLFEKDIQVISNTIVKENNNSTNPRNIFIEGLYEWEKTFFEMIPTIQQNLGNRPPLILGTEANYLTEFHENTNTGLVPPFGVYAGFTNSTPNIPLYKNNEEWNSILEYINERSYKLNKKQQNGSEYFEFSNNSLPESVGRDEQALLFIVIPRAFRNIFFFKVNYQKAVETPQFITDGKKPTLFLDEYFNKEAKQIYSEYIAEFQNTYKGGKRKRKARTLRLKIEKRKTRKRS